MESDVSYLTATVPVKWSNDYSRSLHITVNRTNQPVCHGICNSQWTQFLPTICCAFFIKYLICVQHWFNSHIILSPGLVNYKIMSVDLKHPINFPSLKLIQLTHKNESPISKKTQHQCYNGKEFNTVYGNICCLLWESYKTQTTLGRINTMLINVQPGGTQSNHRDLKYWYTKLELTQSDMTV